MLATSNALANWDFFCNSLEKKCSARNFKCCHAYSVKVCAIGQAALTTGANDRPVLPGSTSLWQR